MLLLHFYLFIFLVTFPEILYSHPLRNPGKLSVIFLSVGLHLKHLNRHWHACKPLKVIHECETKKWEQGRNYENVVFDIYIRQKHRADSDFSCPTASHYKLTPILRHRVENSGFFEGCVVLGAHKTSECRLEVYAGSPPTECVSQHQPASRPPPSAPLNMHLPGGGCQVNFKPGVYCTTGIF